MCTQMKQRRFIRRHTHGAEDGGMLVRTRRASSAVWGLIGTICLLASWPLGLAAHLDREFAENMVMFSMQDKGMRETDVALLDYRDLLAMVDGQGQSSMQDYHSRLGPCTDEYGQNATARYSVSALAMFSFAKAASICDLDPECVGFALASSSVVIYASRAECQVIPPSVIRSDLASREANSSDLTDERREIAARLRRRVGCREQQHVCDAEYGIVCVFFSTSSKI